MRKNLLMN